MIHGADVAVKVMTQDKKYGVDMKGFETEIKVCCDEKEMIKIFKGFDGTSSSKIGPLAWVLQ